MKKFLLGAAAVMAVALPGAAHAQSGHVDLSYQTADRGGGSDVDSTSLAGAFLLGDHFQVNGRYANLEASSSVDYYGIDGFLFNRTDANAYGAFLGYDTLDSSDNPNEWSFGGFYQHYAANSTWTAQLGYSDTEGDVQIITLDGQGRFFLSDNFSLQGNLGYGDVETDFGSSDNFFTAGVGGEYGFTGLPVSIYGGWSHIDFDEGGESDSLGIGARWNFGGGTLRDRDRSGASFERATHSAIELEVAGGPLAPRS